MARSPSPFTELEKIVDQMQESFGRATDAWDIDALESPIQGYRIPVDIEDLGDELQLTADLPGFDKENIHVHVTEERVKIHADREEKLEETDEDTEFIRQERRSRTVRRSIRLPIAVDTADITAEYSNGVLTLQMPKQIPDSETEEIEIT